MIFVNLYIQPRSFKKSGIDIFLEKKTHPSSPWENVSRPEATAMAVAESGSGSGAPQVRQVQALSSPQSGQSPDGNIPMGIYLYIVCIYIYTHIYIDR